MHRENLQNKQKTAAVALRKIGDGSPNEDFEKKFFDNCLIVLHSQNGSWKALYGYSWKEIEGFISTNPEYDEIYYSQEEMDWSDETYNLFNSYMENSGNDTPWQVAVKEAINDTKEEYDGPCFPVDLIYFGKIILTVEVG